MKTYSKLTASLDSEYIHLSEQLRKELESKIERLFLQKTPGSYFDMKFNDFLETADNDVLCAYLVGNSTQNFILSGKLMRGIKIWLCMYYDDRLSVIGKFKTCYINFLPSDRLGFKPVLNIIFSKFLINELLSLLAEDRWKDLLYLSD